MARTGPGVVPPRGKGAQGASCSQDQCVSLGGGPRRTSRTDIERIVSAEGARDPASRALTLLWKLRLLAPRPRRDGIRRPSRRGHGATSRARGAVPTRAPPADGRRESAASGSASERVRAARRAGVPAARAKNPGIPLRTSGCANGRPAKGNRRRTKTPHDAASACGGRDRSKTPAPARDRSFALPSSGGGNRQETGPNRKGR